MKLSNSRIYLLCLALLVSLYGCTNLPTPSDTGPGTGPPPGPGPGPISGPVTRTGTSSTGTQYSVTANPLGPPTWTYTVTSTGSFISVQIHAPSSIKGCTVAVSGATPPSGNNVKNPADTDAVITSTGTGWSKATISLTCDKRNGFVDLFMIEPGTAGSNPSGGVVGPLPGPQ